MAAQGKGGGVRGTVTRATGVGRDVPRGDVVLGGDEVGAARHISRNVLEMCRKYVSYAI